MLIDHADAERVRVTRPPDGVLDPSEDDRALVRRVVAHHALDEGAFAGAVLPEQRVKGAGLERERDVVEGDQRAEPLGHARDLEALRGGVGLGDGPAEPSGAGRNADASATHLDHRAPGGVDVRGSRPVTPGYPGYVRVGRGKPQLVPSVTCTSSSHGRRYFPAMRSCM